MITQFKIFQLGGLSDLIGAQKSNEGQLKPNGAATSVGGGALTPIDSMADHDSHWYPRSPSHYGQIYISNKYRSQFNTEYNIISI